MTKVLFICEGNMMRSQMAEAFYNTLTGTHDATSAGALDVDRGHISKRAREVMDEVGIDTSHLKPKQVTEQMVEEADKIILFPTNFMPEYAKNSPKAERWEVVDPHYHYDQGMDLVRQVRDDIKQKVEKLTGRNA